MLALRRHPGPALVVTGGAAAVVALTVLAAAAVALHRSPATARPPVARASPPTPPAVVRVASASGSTVAWDRPVLVTVTAGRLVDVAAEDDGAAVAGSMSADATSWRSEGTLVPLTGLDVSVTYVDRRGVTLAKQLRLSVGDSAKHLRASVSPVDGDVVGIGMPVAVTFTRTVPEVMRAAVERRLVVTTSPAVAGAWHWFGGQEVHWRPPSYWSPGTKVSVRTDLSRLDVGDGVWGAGVGAATFTVGAAHVSEVDVAAHVMRVYDGGALVRTMPISAGRDRYPTMGGVHIALGKAQLVIMDSATVGIPKGDPDYYYEKVYWNVRISNGGAFVHAAPWSVSEQGRANVSHGCVNLGPDNATWFYAFSRRGDVVEISNTPRAPSPSDAGTMDWNMTWSRWLAGSASGGGTPSASAGAR